MSTPVYFVAHKIRISTCVTSGVTCTDIYVSPMLSHPELGEVAYSMSLLIVVIKGIYITFTDKKGANYIRFASLDDEVIFKLDSYLKCKKKNRAHWCEFFSVRVCVIRGASSFLQDLTSVVKVGNGTSSRVSSPYRHT